MSQLPSADSSPQRANPSDAPAEYSGFEAGLHTFWTKNRGLIQLALVAVLLGIIGREGWQYLAAKYERGVEEEYAKVADKPEALAAFADGHARHPLAGVAYLQLADQEFSAADYKQAVGYYQKAIGALKNDTLLGRARLGNAMSLVADGDKAGGEAALKVLSADQALSKAVRSEATYHLAIIALDAGQTDEVRKLVDEVVKLDLGGSWSQRATLLLSGLPAGTKPADPASAGITFKPSGG